MIASQKSTRRLPSCQTSRNLPIASKTIQQIRFNRFNTLRRVS